MGHHTLQALFYSKRKDLRSTMILIGQYDSPFVRRVGVALTIYGYRFEHWPYSTFRQGDKIAPYNPLQRVPTLIVDEETVIIESGAILDYLDEAKGEKALMPASGPLRQKALYISALATGLADKAVSLTYEKILHQNVSDMWQARCELQIKSVIEALETEQSKLTTAFWQGQGPGHADIAIMSAIDFTLQAHPNLIELKAYPKLMALYEALNERDEFKSIAQVFIPPA
jgi:glutathione S-transferase